MSISTAEKIIDVIRDRVTCAPENSKIAVFRTMHNNKPAFDVVFDSTIYTQKRIRSGDTDYIGSYCKNDNIQDVMKELFQAI